MAEEDDDPIEAPIAASVQVFSCGDCPYPHIVLFGEDKKPIAQAVLPDEILAILAGWWHGKGPHK